MVNNALAKVAGKGTIELDLSFGKKITLLNVLYVLEIRNNLVSIDLLCKRRFRILFESTRLSCQRTGCLWGRVMPRTACVN